MGKTLLSVGLDVGTTTTQMVVSELTVENEASSFAVPKLRITHRKIRYRGDVHFTPLSGPDRVDGPALRALVAADYEAAGITREDVDTGAVIVTGETSRKENARTVLEMLSEFAGDFVVATAGPDLESILAARGAGAVECSENRRVLHMDIGGGTSNLCLLEQGKVLATGCVNVGGRLIRLDENGVIVYCSPVLREISPVRAGQRPTQEQLWELAKTLASVLEMAAGLTPATDILCKLTTQENGKPWKIPQGVTLSFSGGVADCIANRYPAGQFGDIGPLLGRAIGESRLCQGEFFLGRETIRATVIGAGCHSTRLSGSTVFYQNLSLPLKNLPVAVPERMDAASIAQALAGWDQDMVVLALPGYPAPDYSQVKALAQTILQGIGKRPVLVCLEADMAKALGHCLRLQLPEDAPCLCLDGLGLEDGMYLDVGQPVGPALPVVMKTLVLSGGIG